MDPTRLCLDWLPDRHSFTEVRVRVEVRFRHSLTEVRVRVRLRHSCKKDESIKETSGQSEVPISSDEAI